VNENENENVERKICGSTIAGGIFARIAPPGAGKSGIDNSPQAVAPFIAVIFVDKVIKQGW
jgi:hypothetical protein